MEHTGLEPVTSTLPVWRAPNCANAPYQNYNIDPGNYNKKINYSNFPPKA